jgi:hypothetical protein
LIDGLRDQTLAFGELLGDPLVPTKLLHEFAWQQTTQLIAQHEANGRSIPPDLSECMLAKEAWLNGELSTRGLERIHTPEPAAEEELFPREAMNFFGDLAEGLGRMFRAGSQGFGSQLVREIASPTTGMVGRQMLRSLIEATTSPDVEIAYLDATEQLIGYEVFSSMTASAGAFIQNPSAWLEQFLQRDFQLDRWLDVLRREVSVIEQPEEDDPLEAILFRNARQTYSLRLAAHLETFLSRRQGLLDVLVHRETSLRQTLEQWHHTMQDAMFE